MSRQLRIEYSGALYHVTSRGNSKATIFINDDDKYKFLDILESSTRSFNFVCHAYCIMDNHYHLLIETPDANLSAGIHRLNSVYAHYFNKRYDHVGHVFQGRFKAILVQKYDYLLELCRYIVLNPIRAGIVNHPEEFQWSSFASTIGKRRCYDLFLTTEWILSQFDNDLSLARRRYKIFVMEGINTASPMKDIRAGLILGDKSFIKSLNNRIIEYKDDGAIPRVQRYPYREDLSSLFENLKSMTKEKRNKMLFEAFFKHGYTQKELAIFLNKHVVTIGRIIKQIQNV